ncbi:MAG: NAD-dependent epimerase/dehydratase family protein [Anaerolineaceae bacterium]|nr:NAD-dependent epimerase/dehydratase family protein [Anaerolineaceae bacterium]
MKILVTGGSGFIGKVLVRNLIEQGHDLVLIVRPTSHVHDLQDEKINLVEACLFDRTTLERLMSDCDCLIHLANVYSFWEADASIYERINMNATRIVYESALHAGVKKVIHVASAVIWGDAEPLPYTEETPFGNVVYSQYAVSKRKADNMAWRCHKEKGLPLVGVYPASVIGPGDVKSSGQMACDIIKRRLPARGLENSRITFVDVRDVADAIAKIVTQNNVIGERFILGKESIRLGDYMQHISQVSGMDLPLISLPTWAVRIISGLLSSMSWLTKKPPLWGMSLDQTRTFSNGFQCDGSKAERQLGVSYRPVRESLTDLVHWIQEHR